jgi:hypothetical protein
MYVPDVYLIEGDLAQVIPTIFSKPLSKSAMKARFIKFYRRGFIEIQTPREDEIASQEEITKNGWEEK